MEGGGHNRYTTPSTRNGILKALSAKTNVDGMVVVKVDMEMEATMGMQVTATSYHIPWG